jgi:uncharacterized repeat protein (TIGR01451 family)
VKVTTPSGIVLGSCSSTVASVSGGNFTNRICLWDVLKKGDGSTGYDTSPNGVYKVWASQDQYFSQSQSKTDNFSVDLEPAINIVKTADKEFATVGDTIVYNYIVTNTGEVTLKYITVTDDKLGAITLSATELAVGASASGTASYLVAGSDIPGGLVNLATSTGKYGDRTVTDTDTVTVELYEDARPAISIVKTVDRTAAKAGDTITYTYTVENTGNVELTGVTVSDNKLGSITLGTTTLAVGASTTGSATYTVREADPLGLLVNIATATGYYGDADVTDQDSASVRIYSDQEDPSPGISITKTANKEYAKAGDTITYTYTVTNTGNVELTGVTVEDDKLGSITLGATTLAVGASTTGIETYTVSEEDPLGSLVNLATARGYYIETQVSAEADASVLIYADQPEPVVRISITKIASRTTARAGNTITYTYTVTNTGDYYLRDVTVEDDKLGSIILSETELDVDESTTGTATYTVKSSDPLGALVNTAIATGWCEDMSATDWDDATVTILRDQEPEPDPSPAIRIIKTASKDTAAAGDTITYTYKVKNTGDVRLRDITVVDDKLGAITVGDTSLLPGETTEGTAVYTVKESDRPGPIENTATAMGRYGDRTVKDTDDASVAITGGIEIPPEPPVSGPPVEPTPEPPVAAPPDLPFTGGNPMAFIYSGGALTALGLLLRRRLR